LCSQVPIKICGYQRSISGYSSVWFLKFFWNVDVGIWSFVLRFSCSFFPRLNPRSRYAIIIACMRRADVLHCHSFWLFLILILLGAVLPPRSRAQRPLGLDVSHYQGQPDWTSVRGSGITFSWAKATEGLNTGDADFTYNELNGKAAGVYMGALPFCASDQLCRCGGQSFLERRRQLYSQRWKYADADARYGNLHGVHKCEQLFGLGESMVQCDRQRRGRAGCHRSASHLCQFLQRMPIRRFGVAVDTVAG
jgi:hypothetical protein